jgi:hypothetical protein
LEWVFFDGAYHTRAVEKSGILNLEARIFRLCETEAGIRPRAFAEMNDALAKCFQQVGRWRTKYARSADAILEPLTCREDLGGKRNLGNAVSFALLAQRLEKEQSDSRHPIYNPAARGGLLKASKPDGATKVREGTCDERSKLPSRRPAWASQPDDAASTLRTCAISRGRISRT